MIKMYGLTLVATIIAAIIVMGFHEIIRFFVFLICEKDNDRNKLSEAFKIHKYIDPIGILFALIFHAPFSRPGKLRATKTNTLTCAGRGGILALVFLFLASVLIAKTTWAPIILTTEEIEVKYTIGYILKTGMIYVNYFVIMFSLTMLILNFIPLPTFNIGYIIAGKAPLTYIRIIRHDLFVKLLLLFAVTSGVITNAVREILNIINITKVG